MSLTPAVLLVLSAAAQEPAATDLLTLLAPSQDAELRDAARARPNDVRAALDDLFARSVRAQTAEARVRLFEQADRLATVYRDVWEDDYLGRRVEQFVGWSIEERRLKLAADSLRQAGIDAFYAHGPAAAMALWERSLGQYRALGDVAGQASAFANLGAGYYATGRFEQALRQYEEAIRLAELAGDIRTTGNALGNMASVYKDREQLDVAAAFYRRALQLRPLTGDRRGEAADHNNLGLVREALGDLAGAEQSYRRALEINRHDDRDRSTADNLTNLANLSTRRGEYDPALALYVEALSLRRSEEDRRGEALNLHNVGLLHLRWGDYPAALRSLRDALAILDAIGPAWQRAEVRADVATVYAGIGDLSSALDALEQAQEESLGDEMLAPALALARADILTAMNDHELAAQFYALASSGFSRLRDEPSEAEALVGLGYLHTARDDLEAAEEAFTRALHIQRKLDDRRPAALTHVLLGDVQYERGDTTQARQSYRSALDAHRTLGDPIGEAQALSALADLDRELGDGDAALTGYRSAIAVLDDTPAPALLSYLHLGLGLTLKARRDLMGAATAFRRAIAGTQSVSASLLVEEQRYAFLEDKWGAYAELASVEVALNQPARAFETSERMRARQLVDVMERGRTIARATDRTLLARERYLLRRIDELTRALEGSYAGRSALRGPADPAGGDDARADLAEARAEYERLLVRMKASSPEYADLVTGTAVRASDVQALVPADAALIEYLVADDWTIAFVVTGQGIEATELPIGRETIGQLVRFFRGTVNPQGDGYDDELWRAPLRRLYVELIAPLEQAGRLEGRRLLVFAPHAELHYLPFQALLAPDGDGERFLIESYDVAYVPSGTVWAQLARSGTTGAAGTLAMAPHPRELAHSAGEVRAIGTLEPGADVFVGAEATEDRLVALASHQSVIHLASFGVLNRRNPLFSYVRLNPGEHSDGRLEVHEVFGLDLSADLVVLSACHTGVGAGARRDVPPGDDWVGLVRAFLYAGARSVMASLWPVDDRATAELMESFYRNRSAGLGNVTALAAAQRAMIRGARNANPFYWAAFALHGGVR